MPCDTCETGFIFLSLVNVHKVLLKLVSVHFLSVLLWIQETQTLHHVGCMGRLQLLRLSQRTALYISLSRRWQAMALRTLVALLAFAAVGSEDIEAAMALDETFVIVGKHFAVLRVLKPNKEYKFNIIFKGTKTQ